VDLATELQIQKALDRLMEGPPLCHRTACQHGDERRQIIVMEGGRFARNTRGLENNAIYAEIYNSS
jgi:hypothetical protein